jgi:S-DNA-T family DNA segregation ATPase FtsK/SpoIIIE
MQLAWMLPSILFGLYLGATTGTWFLLAMSLITALVMFGFRRFNESRNPDLSEEVSFSGGEVWIGDYQLPNYEIFWKKEWHALVFAAHNSTKQQPVFNLELNLETDLGHCLIIGPTGSGKSELMKLLLQQVVSKDPNCELMLVDFKGGATFSQFAGLAQSKLLVTDIDGHEPGALWQQVQAELGHRELRLAACRVSRIEDIIELSQQLPRRYIFIDELAAALAESPLAQAALTAVAARGRTLGVHLVLATQSAQSVPRALITNLRARVALADADPIELAQLNIKRVADPVQIPTGWARGIFQKTSEVPRQFIFPLGGKFCAF